MFINFNLCHKFVIMLRNNYNGNKMLTKTNNRPIIGTGQLSGACVCVCVCVCGHVIRNIELDADEVADNMA